MMPAIRFKRRLAGFFFFYYGFCRFSVQLVVRGKLSEWRISHWTTKE